MEDAELKESRTAVERLLLKIKEDIKRIASGKDEISSAKATALTKISNIKLPRLKIPTFDVNILKRHVSWEQFDSAIHSRSSFSDSDKLN